MKDVIIVSGGNIQRDFALDFLKKNKTEKVDLIAADRGVEFFKGKMCIRDRCRRQSFIRDPGRNSSGDKRSFTGTGNGPYG